jgi:hypothetical protein
VIRKLVNAGNSVERVSKWIGHRTLDVTFRYYYGITATEAASSMHIPWLQETAPQVVEQETPLHKLE